jgi:hypothetical protein
VELYRRWISEKSDSQSPAGNFPNFEPQGRILVAQVAKGTTNWVMNLSNWAADYLWREGVREREREMSLAISRSKAATDLAS